MRFSATLALLLVCLGSAARAEVRLPAVLTDHMVIQRGLPVHVWGYATPGEAVRAAFRGQSATTTADPLGRFSLYFAAGEAGGPFELQVNNVTRRDILVGDVWVASGQSNMEWELRGARNGQADAASASNPNIRLFRVQRKVSDYPLEDVQGQWTAVNPETAATFSAVAYLFGRQLQPKLNVPIGLIESAWGGTPAEAWTSLRALGSDPGLMPVFAHWSGTMDRHSTTLLEIRQSEAEWQAAAAKAKAEGKPEPGRPWRPNQDNCDSPAGLWNAMIAPLTPFPIRGAIWYQGETNASPARASHYTRLFQTMIRDWRRAWNSGDFPFLFVQLANFKTDGGEGWPLLREAQFQTLALKNTGMAVTIDVGEPLDIHPKDKQTVADRLALAARAIAYGEAIEFSGPLFRQAAREGNTVRVWFDHAAGLKVKGEAVLGVEVAGADGVFQTAGAWIDKDTLVVSSPSVGQPRAVRYAWRDAPDANLYNGAGLPASPFRWQE